MTKAIIDTDEINVIIAALGPAHALSMRLATELAKQPKYEGYRAMARDQWHRDGECEIDPDAPVSHGADSGAYVQAWVWVYDEMED